MQAELKRWNPERVFPQPGTWCMDTMKIMEKVGESAIKGLGAAYESYTSLKPTKPHAALHDVDATVWVFIGLLDR